MMTQLTLHFELLQKKKHCDVTALKTIARQLLLGQSLEDTVAAAAASGQQQQQGSRSRSMFVCAPRVPEITK